MLQLNFKINKIYLYSEIIRQYKSLNKAGKIMANRLWKKSSFAYSIISRTCFDRSLSNLILENNNVKDFSQSFQKNLVQMQKTLKQEVNSESFLKIYKKTREYKSQVQDQWDNNKEKSLKILQEITGLELLSTEIIIYLIHPKLKTGRYWRKAKQNIITWGHSEDWKNYTTVYLCHEIMHFLTKDYKGDRKILHALIELVCDNELRIQLNGQGGYFKEENHKIGHKSLRKLEKKILPKWQEYLKNKKKSDINILDLAKSLEAQGLYKD